MGKFNDLTGKKFNRLLVLKRAENYVRRDGSTRTMWLCKCDCGNTIVVTGDALTCGRQFSCGCYRKEHTSSMFMTHGKTNTRLYGVWSAIKNRCKNPNTYEYKFYGARGITLCREWETDFDKFYEWAMANGYDENAPRGLYTVDRIDPNGNYCPENCRLISQQAQMNNIRTNHLLSYRGETHTIAEWSRITGIDQFKIRNRVSKLGWTVERALETI